MERIRALGPTVLEMTEFTEAEAFYNQVKADIKAFQADTWRGWCELVVTTSEQQLKKPLLL